MTSELESAAPADKPSRATEIDALAGDPEFMMSLARGLAVITRFAEHRKPLTISQMSQRTCIPRASVRRCLHTLVKLGYAQQDGQSFFLRPKALGLGYAYLSSNSISAAAQPLLDQVRDSLRESCSVGVLENDEIFYVARSETSRIMSISLRVGSRLPLYCTSIGRMLLSHLPSAEQEAYLARTTLLRRTSKTVTQPGVLLDILERVKSQGYSIVDQEMEIGLRSVAVPVFGESGSIVAAINVGTQSARTSIPELQSRYLPEIRKVAHELSLRGF